MSTLMFVVAVGVAVIALLLLATRIRSGKGARAKRVQKSIARPAAERETTRWRAVRIKPGLICCDAASRIGDEVFLASESPKLPLEGCGERNCQCKYIHLEDRRSGGDRRIELGELGAFLPANQVERRRRAGRRATDIAA